MQDTQQHFIARRIGSRMHGRWNRNYAKGKLSVDPAFAAVAECLRDSDKGVLDIGCGIGLLGFYLRERGFAGAYRGLDFDRAKIAAARQVAEVHYPDLAFEEGRAQALPEFRGHVALLDVLHYLDHAGQQTLLADAAARTANDGLLVIRTVLRTPGWRFHLTALEEHFLRAIGWMRTPARHYPEREQIETPLLAAGFHVDVQPLWGKTPFNSWFIIARHERS